MAAPPLLCILVLTLCILSVTADVFVSIDCGSSDSYTDQNLIAWQGDDGFIQNGQSHTVQPTANSSIPREMNTLRAFTTLRKNCYIISSIRRGRVLVRASFYYGNYDNRSSPPTFGLLFDGNYWTTVNTSTTQYFFREVIYVMKSDFISVCVAQIYPGQFPFISALEVRYIDSYMYPYLPDQNFPMFLRSRFAYGANRTIRSIDDPYDRIWTPVAAPVGLSQVTSTAFISTPGYNDNPPPAVLHNAITAIRPNGIIQLVSFPPVEVNVYINWYFSEVTQLLPNQTRSFRIFMNNLSFSSPILPPYGNFSELYVSNFTLPPSTTFYLVPTNVSTLPPLINALEIFIIGDALMDGTSRADVRGLASLQNAFEVLRGWSGDPCLPGPYSWEWINCSTDSTPRVTALFLGGFGLSGMLPNFSSMDALRTIDLHNNSLNGPIPGFLGAMPNLQQLNLANNRFNGTVPASLLQRRGLNLVLTGNPELCTSGTSCPNTGTSNSTQTSAGWKTEKNHKLCVILGTIIPFFVIIWGQTLPQ